MCKTNKDEMFKSLLIKLAVVDLQKHFESYKSNTLLIA